MSFMEESGLCDPIGDTGDLFDHIDDLLDFPGSGGSGGDDVLGMGMGMDIDIDMGMGISMNLDVVEPSSQGGEPAVLDIVSVHDPPELSAFPPLPLHVDNGSLLSAGCSGHVDAGIIDCLVFKDEEQNLGPCDELDLVQLEWMSNFFDESNSSSMDSLIPNVVTAATDTDTVTDTASVLHPKPSNNHNICGTTAQAPIFKTQAKTNRGHNGEDPCFRTPSPKSVLETSGGTAFPSSSSSSSSSYSSSSTSCSADGGSDVMNNERHVLTLRVHGRPRSKRPRPRVAISFVSPPVSEPRPPSLSSGPESFDESCPPPLQPMKKKKQFLLGSDCGEESGSPPPVRKCMHCEITKTPQWRAGPMGPKTLCNACGVRYKSGRLFPEYRPAASPTYVPLLHSNSHKKVVEMRLKTNQKPTTALSGVAQKIRSCDLLEYLRRG